MRPKVLAESFTTLPEDRFFIHDNDGYPEVWCDRCQTVVTSVDEGDDLNTLIRLSYDHTQTCTPKEQD